MLSSSDMDYKVISEVCFGEWKKNPISKKVIVKNRRALVNSMFFSLKSDSYSHTIWRNHCTM